MKDFAEEIESALSNDRATTNFNVTGRQCESDNFDGIEYKITGEFVSVRPILEVIESADGYTIESITHTEQDGSKLLVFVAEIPDQTTYTFVN